MFTGRAQSSLMNRDVRGWSEAARRSRGACKTGPLVGVRFKQRSVSARALSCGSHLQTWKPGITGFKIWSFSPSHLFRPVPDWNLNPESLRDDSYLNDIQQILFWGLDRFHPFPWQVVGSDVL